MNLVSRTANLHPAEDKRRPRSASRIWLIRVFIFLAAVFTIRYFHWRVGSTMNPAAVWFFYIFLVAEMLNFIEAGLFYFTTWKPTRRTSQPAISEKSVDVFITTYDEPVSLLRETALCAVSIRYPHKTYLLDDGNRPEVEELARELGCTYISRKERAGAKAGNLNNALKMSEGEFIVTLDADHIPMPDLVDQLIGFLADPKVAIVQTTQDFYNLDSFQHLTQWERQRSWQQQELFFSVIQPGKDAYNATFYCGSPAMLRRKALGDVGGFASESITEDMHTGLRLQKKGWNVVYYNRTVARGLAPQTYRGFATQWERWGRGAMQVLRSENPLFGRGLSFGQRLSYFASFYFYWMSYQKFIYIATPIFCLLTGIFPLVAAPRAFAIYFLPYFILNIVATASLQGGLRGFWLSEEFNIIKMPVLMKTILGVFRRDAVFKVTPKAQDAAASWTEAWMQSLLLLGVVAAVLVGGWKLHYAPRGYFFWAIVVNVTWAAFYIALLIPVIWRALRHQELRGTYRFPHRLDVPVLFGYNIPGGGHVVGRGFARNLNRNGFSITQKSAIPSGAVLAVEMSLPRGTIRAHARVVRHKEFFRGPDKRVSSGLVFEQIDPADQDAISKHLFWEVAPRHGHILNLTKTSQTRSAGA
ncbi:MAG TPA: glycosyltransferase family 2 protein [Candidatus Acidoferrales bacterium]|nr:glycosyltransferase family 2 protein [Candidatus Acidoferrales bacterium]